MTQRAAFKCSCQACGSRLEAPIELNGTAIECPHCHQTTVLDDPGEQAAGTARAPDQLTVKDLVAAFQGRVKPSRSSLFYNGGLAIVAAAMVILPILYVLLILAAAWGTFYWATHFTFLLKLGIGGFRVGIFKAFCYFAPLFMGAVLVLFMIKPLFARRIRGAQPLALNPESEPLLFAFIERICSAVGAAFPSRIDLDCQLNASAGFRRGFRSMLGNDLVLTIGLPLAAGLSMRELAGVLAHEFGHFTQGVGMRLTYIIRSVNGWFARVVFERDAWDARLEEMRDSQEGWISMLAGLACLGVWFSRQVLKLLMLAGHGIGCFMLRQMEYDADTYEIKLAGSPAFESTYRRMHTLSVILSDIYKKMRPAWNLNRRLPESLPALLAHEDRQFPLEQRTRLEDRMCLQETSLFDTHPSAGDRIRRARQANEPGIFHLDLPATALFSNFEAVARQVTMLHYADDLGIPVGMGKLVPIEPEKAVAPEPPPPAPVAEAAPVFAASKLKIRRGDAP